MPSLDVIADWSWKIATGVLSAIAFVWARLANKDKVTGARIDAIHEDIGTHADRLSIIETKLAHLPTHHDMAMIHEKVNELNSCVSRVEGEFKQMNHGVRLIHQHLLQKDKS
ncbi:DUF2730 family protein [Methylobacillus flagellatus]|uniref:DUF2730 family protein n=1 Tax=Methylobacillus flagellatus (strain ATCC 51484 / DSM 6875 / VKM B-1610 / KT) TaxID=265072 RepID=Q1GXS0_METFK|nr:DUF2730 family protein [Methylobacillus flagellatus]ABE50967.1 hypothetical protein Mfla_2704 [Methylobacillus flagellatus KT]